jgi:elongation factor Ts
MIEVTAKQVRELRSSTGAPMMTCKSALLECKGDVEAAKDWLRTKGVEVAGKKSGRDANEGLVGVCINNTDAGVSAAMVTVNCETDFVAKNVQFQEFVAKYAQRWSMGASVDSGELIELIAAVGENIQLGGNAVLNKTTGVVASYVHNKVAEGLGSIGVLVHLDGEPSDELASLAKDIAMHIAALNPKAVDENSLDAEWLAHERSIFVEQAKDSGKPEAIIEKMVDGRMKKVMRENTLFHQGFVKTPDRTVGDILTENNAAVSGFVRFAIGE